MTRICVFNRHSGVSIDDWPDAELPPRVMRDGAVYCRHLVSLLSSARTVDEAVFYADCSLTPAEEFVVFETLFPNRGGVFQIDRAD